MNFLADEGVESAIVEGLRANGHSVVYIAEFARQLDDRSILEMARNEGLILITNDKDFGEMVFRERLSAHGILLLRLETLVSQARAKLVVAAVQLYGAELGGAFSVLSPGAIRIRRLT